MAAGCRMAEAASTSVFAFVSPLCVFQFLPLALPSSLTLRLSVIFQNVNICWLRPSPVTKAGHSNCECRSGEWRRSSRIAALPPLSVPPFFHSPPQHFLVRRFFRALKFQFGFKWNYNRSSFRKLRQIER